MVFQNRDALFNFQNSFPAAISEKNTHENIHSNTFVDILKRLRCKICLLQILILRVCIEYYNRNNLNVNSYASGFSKSLSCRLDSMVFTANSCAFCSATES